MADAKACAGRVERLRALMAERGYDAVILRNNPDLRWLTGAERTFDDEVAHTAFVTADGQWLHTDSRYANTFRERLGADTPWVIDEEIVSAAAWAAERARATRSRVVAVEDTCDLAFFDAFNQAMSELSIACLTPRMHSDICDLRMVKDAEAHAEEDKRQKEEVEVRNQTDSLCYSTEQTIADLGDKVSADVKGEAEAAISEAKKALEGTDVDAIKAAGDKLQEVAYKLAHIVYADAQQETGGSAAASSDDDVVDADYEVVDDDQDK